MFFRKKSPQRLYLPARSSWYTRPRPLKRQRFWVRGKRKIHLQRQLSSFKSQWLYWIIGAAVLVGLILVLFFSTYLKIAKINVVRHDLNVDPVAIQQLLKPYIGENILLFDRQLAAEKVKTNFTEYAKVDVKKILPNTLRVELETQPLVFNLHLYYTLPQAPDAQEPLDPPSPQDPLTETPQPTEQKALLNAAGQVILGQEENLQLITLTVRHFNRPLENRETFISPERLEALQKAIERFEMAFPNLVESAEYFPDGREIHLKIDNGLVLWITFEKDPVAQIDKLYSIYQPAALDQENLAYIDLRVAERVIYCPTGAACDR